MKIKIIKDRDYPRRDENGKFYGEHDGRIIIVDKNCEDLPQGRGDVIAGFCKETGARCEFSIFTDWVKI